MCAGSVLALLSLADVSAASPTMCHGASDSQSRPRANSSRFDLSERAFKALGLSLDAGVANGIQYRSVGRPKNHSVRATQVADAC